MMTIIGKLRRALYQALLQLETVHLGHADVDDQTPEQQRPGGRQNSGAKPKLPTV